MNFFYRSNPTFLLLALTSRVLLAESSSAVPNAKAPFSSKQTQVVEGYGKLPLSFEPNEGQVDSQIRFLSRGDGYNLALTSSEAVLSLAGRDCADSLGFKRREHLARNDQRCAPSPDSVLRMGLLGSNSNARIEGQGELPGKSNYFVSDDSSQWHTNISNYRKVQYRDIYPGIDLVYYGNQRQLEHDFIVNPGADPKKIRFSFKGAKEVFIDKDGNLALSTDSGSLLLRQPVVYQEIDGKRKPVSGQYVRSDANEVGFDLGAYDRKEKLVIDPVLVYSTYFGGSQRNYINGIAADAEGNAYITGYTSSADFPLSNPIFFSPPKKPGNQLGFVSKISADGQTLIYSTYLGSQTGSVLCFGIAVDRQGSAYTTGNTSAKDFPVVNAFQSKRLGPRSAFVTKLNATGSALEYSTYLGGKTGADALGIAVDLEGSAYVTGYLETRRLPNGQFEAGDFPTVHPYSNIGGMFVSKISAAGSDLEYSTRLGGGDVIEFGNAIAVDPLGEAMITGYTSSDKYPLRHPLSVSAPAGYQRTIVTKLNRNGSDVIFSTYFRVGQGNGIATNASGDAFVTGEGYQITDGYQSLVAFVTRIKAAGSDVVYATQIGEAAFGTAITVDAVGNAYFTGYTYQGLPVVNPIQSGLAGIQDAFIAKFDPLGSTLIYSTYFGGSGTDRSLGIAIDGRGNVYIAGLTFSSDLPLTAALQPKPLTGANVEDGFVAKISEASDFYLTNAVDKATVGPGDDLHYTITVTNVSSNFASGTVEVTSLRDRFRTCTVSNGDPCRFVVLGGRAAVDISSLAKWGSVTILIHATAAKTAGDYNTITNTAAIAGVSASATTTVRETADIGIVSSLVNGTNGLLHYAHTVTNLGPDNSHAVLLLDPLPAHTTFVSASTTAGKCVFHSDITPFGAVRCPLNNPAAGSSVQVDVVLQATSAACPAVLNTASVTSQSIDAIPNDDAATVLAPLPADFCKN